MEKNKVKEKIEAEYKDFYGQLLDKLIKDKSIILEQETLYWLVEKHKQRLNKLSVVRLNQDDNEPLLMYSLGYNNVFWEHCRSVRSCGFYVRNEFFRDCPLVREVWEDEWGVVKESVFNYFGENNEEGKK